MTKKMTNEPKKAINKGGRPAKPIDWDTVNGLMSIFCTGEEIAGIVGVSYDTLERRIRDEHGISFTDYFKKHSAGGRSSLRRKQFDMAMKGNVSMLVWLGKQHLGQSDKVEQKNDIEYKPVMIELPSNGREVLQNKERSDESNNG